MFTLISDCLVLHMQGEKVIAKYKPEHTLKKMFFNRFPNPKSKPCKRGGLGKALKLLGDFVPSLYTLEIVV